MANKSLPVKAPAQLLPAAELGVKRQLSTLSPPYTEIFECSKVAGSTHSWHSTLHPHQFPPIHRITLGNPLRLGLPSFIKAGGCYGNVSGKAPVDPVHGLHERSDPHSRRPGHKPVAAASRPPPTGYRMRSGSLGSCICSAIRWVNWSC